MFRAKRRYFKPPRSRLGFCEETKNYANETEVKFYISSIFSFEAVSFRGQNLLKSRPDWSPLGVKFKISDEHPRLFHIGAPPPPPHWGVPLLLTDINRSIYRTCGKIGGHKQVGRIITPVILDVRELKQKSEVIKFLNLMNMQIRTIDVERSKRREFDELSRSVYIFAQRNFYTM